MCVSVKSVSYPHREKSNSCEGSRKATLFENTSRNFVMEGFCIFTIFIFTIVRCSKYDFISCFIKTSKSSQFFSLPSFAYISLFLRLNRRYVTILRNFFTNFLRTSIARGMRSFPTIRAKFRVSFRKVSVDAFTRDFLV